MAAKATPPQDDVQTPAEAGAALARLEEGTVGTAIKNAKTMISAKKRIQGDLQAARDFLGQSIIMGVCNPQQIEWIEATLPKRTRGSRDED